MEQARLLIAIVLSFLVLLGWEYFFVDKQDVNQHSFETQESLVNEKQVELKEQIDFDDKQHHAHIDNISKDISDSVYEPVELTVSNQFYIAKISSKGAIFTSFELKEYKKMVSQDSPLKELIDPSLHKGLFQLGFVENSVQGLEKAVFEPNIKSNSINVDQGSQEIVFSWVSLQGVVVEKKYTFYSDSYLIGLDILVQNQSDVSIEDKLKLSVIGPQSAVGTRYIFEGPIAFINNKLELVKVKDIKKQNMYTGNLSWMGLTDRYFLTSIVPTQPQNACMQLFYENDVLEAQYVGSKEAIKAGSIKNYKFNIFLGPKSLGLLKSIGYDLDEAIHFGFFDILAKPCLMLMNFLYSLIPNYGIAIIVLTILVKIAFWPLGNKSYKSMNDMRKLQPLMMELREKYKHDKQRMNQEVMGLYKTYKVNPMSGCLPLVAQVPIFFALYRMLYEAIELRHAPFIGWINDLAAPDRLFSFDFSIPFMQPPYGIPVLTIVMGATMFLQQKMSPSSGDPTQAKMMMFLPIVFTFIFINFSSGLVLYWLVNNVLSIAQQYYIMKKNA